MSNTGNSRLGFFVNEIQNPAIQLNDSIDHGFHFLVAPLCPPGVEGFEPFCDLTLSSSEWASQFVARIVHSNLDKKPLKAKAELEEQINYSAHLGLRAMLFDLPRTSKGIVTLASLINEKLNTEGGLPSLPSVWISVDLNSRELVERQNNDQLPDNPAEDCVYEDLWSKWNQFRRLLLPSRRVGVVLECSPDNLEQEDAERWAGEPIRALVIGTNCFLTNRKNFPVLSKRHQAFITLVRDRTAYEAHLILRISHQNADFKLYAQYLNYVCTMTAMTDATARYARGFEDVLQLPLQPLMDNLESHTYEIFEKDPIKYEQYRRAIAAAMQTITEKTLVLMVVGAGRGPLVHASLQAALEKDKYIRVYAVEKNPNAVHTLKSLNKRSWGGEEGLKNGRVQVIASDMRDWLAPEKADIVVSELLGSFGDNELSPECLDGVYRNVRPDTISIPQAYTSYLAPIMSQKLHLDTLFNQPTDKPWYYAFECTYVVYLRNFYLIDLPKPLFTFEHKDLSLTPDKRDNHRHDIIDFKARMDACLHGFAGFFDAQLFGDVHISIVAGQESKDMFSWFPLWIPLKNPLDVKSGDQIEVSIWRHLSKHRVWYEWAVIAPMASDIHNSNGRSQSIGL